LIWNDIKDYIPMDGNIINPFIKFGETNVIKNSKEITTLIYDGNIWTNPFSIYSIISKKPPIIECEADYNDFLNGGSKTPNIEKLDEFPPNERICNVNT